MFLFWGMLARERLWAATFVVYKYIMLKGCFLDGEVMMKENERKKLGKFEDFGLFWNFVDGLVLQRQRSMRRNICDLD